MTAQERLNAIKSGVVGLYEGALWMLVAWSIFQTLLDQATLCGVLLLLARKRKAKNEN